MSKKEIKKINIKEIKNPEFLKGLNKKELEVLSEDIRNYILEMTSKNGGHVSSNVGAVEAIISLCKNFDFSKDKIIFDVGHQCYTYKILTGRSLERLRHSDGISGFQKRDESPYDHYEAGHSSTSISAALGMAISRDLNEEKYDIIAFIGDSSITNGLALEALNHLALSGHKVIIVLNDNGMSISKPVGGIASIFRNFSTSNIYLKSKSKTRNILQKNRFGRFLLKGFTRIKNFFKRHLINYTLFDSLGFAFIGPIDGHDFRQLDKAIAKAKKIDHSVVIHIKTIKGKGYPYAEMDDVGDWHGLSGFDLQTGSISGGNNNFISWSEQYHRALKMIMEQYPKTVTIMAATGHGSSLDDLFELYKQRTIDVGIAEEHALTMASGVSINGYHPIVSMYSTFLQRGYDEMSHDIARMNLDCTLLIDRAGLVGADGDTHQGVYDEAFLYTIPHTNIAMASRPSEVLSLIKESLNHHSLFAIRYPREKFLEQELKEDIVSYGSWIKELSGKDTAIISVGPNTLPLKEELIKQNKNVTLYNAIYQKPYLDKYIDELLNYQKIIMYNPYATKEGFAKDLESKLIEKGYKGTIICRCVPTEFIKHASIKEQREKYSLLYEDVISLL